MLPVVEYVDDEFTLGSNNSGLNIGPTPDVLKLRINPGLTKRKLYGLGWATGPNDPATFIELVIRFYKQGSRVGFLPWCFGQAPVGNAIGRTQASVLNAIQNNSAEDDSLVTYNDNQSALGLNAQSQTIINPQQNTPRGFHITCDADNIRVDILQCFGPVAGVRLWMSCVSFQP